MSYVVNCRSERISNRTGGDNSIGVHNFTETSIFETQFAAKQCENVAIEEKPNKRNFSNQEKVGNKTFRKTFRKNCLKTFETENSAVKHLETINDSNDNSHS